MQKAFTLIQNSKHIVFASHINPDADTLGSSLGLMHSLAHLGKKFTVYNIGGIAPASLDFLPGIEALTGEFPTDADLVVALDCGDIKRLGLKDGNYKLLNIDHHASNPLYGDENIVDATAASTASVVLEFLRGIGIAPSKEAAVSLYAALASDTGFFKYDSVDKRAFLDGAYLVECGANASEIAIAMTEREPLSKIRLQASILSTLKITANGKVASLFMTNEMLKSAGAMQDEADGAAETARSIYGVEVSLFLREQEDGYIRGSLRSKTAIDVNKIAKLFSGGGHLKAAGFTVKIEKEFLVQVEDIIKQVEQSIGIIKQ